MNDHLVVFIKLLFKLSNTINNIFYRILDLQKERYFESLSAKYWNTSGKGSCFNSDDNEGITLESLGKKPT